MGGGRYVTTQTGIYTPSIPHFANLCKFLRNFLEDG